MVALTFNRHDGGRKESCMKMLTEQRRNEVFAALGRDGTVTVSALAKQLDVTMQTIRKDIEYWEGQGVLKKTHGGAVISSEDVVRHISMRVGENMEAKKRLAEKSLEFLPEKGVVYLDCGSTISCLARALSTRSGLTIVTSSIIVANTLSDSRNTIHLTGGKLRGDTMGTVGMWTDSALRSIRIDVAVLGSSGFQGFDGPAVDEFADAEVKRTVMGRSRFNMLLADSTKFACSSLVAFCDWKDIDLFITNDDADKELSNSIRAHTKLIMV